MDYLRALPLQHLPALGQCHLFDAHGHRISVPLIDEADCHLDQVLAARQRDGTAAGDDPRRAGRGGGDRCDEGSR